MIYFIQEEDSCYIKIGYAESSPFNRLDELQTGNHRSLKIIGLIPGNKEKEQSWHKCYEKYRVRNNGGTEWFELPKNMINSIKTNDSEKYPILWKQAMVNWKTMIKQRKLFIRNYQDDLHKIGFDPIEKMDNEQLYNAYKYISSFFCSEEKTIKIDVKGQSISIERVVS